MPHQSAAPGRRFQRQRPGGGGSNHERDDLAAAIVATQVPETLPAAIRQRLAAEGVSTLEQWRALGHRRLQIWGITRSTARTLDELAKAMRSHA